MRKNLTRLVSLLCAMLFALSCALAEPVPSAAVITIDGVRAAFFSQSGAYCPPVEVGGIVYVPALSLGGSLGIPVEADASTLAVSVDGVRTAFFGPDGAYLSPVVIEGEVYVPLQAFVENVGMSVVIDGGSYAVSRTGAAPAPAATPVPTPVPTQAPMYGHVPVGGGELPRVLYPGKDPHPHQRQPRHLLLHLEQGRELPPHHQL